MMIFPRGHGQPRLGRQSSTTRRRRRQQALGPHWSPGENTNGDKRQLPAASSQAGFMVKSRMVTDFQPAAEALLSTFDDMISILLSPAPIPRPCWFRDEPVVDNRRHRDGRHAAIGVASAINDQHRPPPAALDRITPTCSGGDDHPCRSRRLTVSATADWQAGTTSFRQAVRPHSRATTDHMRGPGVRSGTVTADRLRSKTTGMCGVLVTAHRRIRSRSRRLPSTEPAPIGC